MSKAVEYAEWLRNCEKRHTAARPVRVTLQGKVYEGGLYTIRDVFQVTERACTERQVKPGEEYFTHRISLLGERPRPKRKTVYVWPHTMPLDARVAESIGEWYVGGWYEGGLDDKEAEKRFHPFGHHFMLHDWLSATYGPYKGHKIDTLERSTYLRSPMTVEYLD